VKAALLILSGLLAASAMAQAPDLVVDLEQRLARDGSRQVNAYLRSNWTSKMTPLYQRTADCDFEAIDLTMNLNRGAADRRVALAFVDSLRLATGKCMSFVLERATAEEVPIYCRSIASWTAMQTNRELRRRIASIESDAILRVSEQGKACHAAYWHELRNTRVGLRATPPVPKSP
jgi:hypothetical protein